MPNNDLGELRRSAVLVTGAPGAIVDFRADQAAVSAIVCGLEDWVAAFSSAPADAQLVYEDRLQKKLQVSFFRLPPVLTEENKRGRTVNPALLAARFPDWLQCPECHRIAPSNKWAPVAPGHASRKCAQCSGSGRIVHVIPVRFVMACEKGHLDEFPWHSWVGHAKGCECPKGFLKLEARGSGLGGLVLSCPDCGASRTMEGIFSAKTWENSHCSGKMPWLGKDADEPCDRVPRTLQRGASNMFYPCMESALSIPPWSDNLQDELGQFWVPLNNVEDLEGRKNLAKLLLNTSTYQRWLDKRGWKAEDVAEQIEKRKSGLLVADWENLRLNEYRQFTNSNAPVKEDNFEMRIEKVPSNLSHLFSHIVRLVRLREVRVLKGFTRIFPPDMTKNCLAPISKAHLDWLPAIEVRGEGIFIGLNLDEVRAWETSEQVKKKADRIQTAYINQWCERNPEDQPPIRHITPRFLLVHTLAHILMRQLSLDCGYSSTSLRERLYVDDGDMAGLLIYTASSDTDGTLGGLQREGKMDKVGLTIPKAIRSVEWCSSDPLCIGGLMTGSESLCGAACHACVLAPETSCEEFNQFLDRGMLIGWPDHPDAGYFKTLLRDNNA